MAVCAAVGCSALVSIAAFSPWQLSALAGWDVAALTLVSAIWLSIRGLDSAKTKAVATGEDDSRVAALAVVVFSSVASLVGVLLGIVKARQLHGALRTVLIVASVLAVVLSWLAVHTTFVLIYAHRYFDGGEGFRLPSGEDPAYIDFAYLSFTIGMTFQVSDIEVTTRALRRLVLWHSFLSYVFGTVIIGLTINVIGGLLG